MRRRSTKVLVPVTLTIVTYDELAAWDHVPPPGQDRRPGRPRRIRSRYPAADAVHLQTPCRAVVDSTTHDSSLLGDRDDHLKFNLDPVDRRDSGAGDRGSAWSALRRNLQIAANGVDRGAVQRLDDDRQPFELGVNHPAVAHINAHMRGASKSAMTSPGCIWSSATG